MPKFSHAEGGLSFLHFFKRRLKQVDAFKQNINLIWYKQNKETNKMDFIDKQGSWFGGIMTGLPVMEIETGNSTSGRPRTLDMMVSSNFPQTLL